MQHQQHVLGNAEHQNTVALGCIDLVQSLAQAAVYSNAVASRS